METHRISCFDGRKVEAVIGAPGGDLGVIIAALSTHEAITGQALDDETVEHFVHSLPEALYIHTDEEMEYALIEAIKRDDRFSNLLENRTPEQLIASGTGAETTDDLLLDLKVKYWGCGHFQLMCENPAAYGTRLPLIHAVQKAGFRRMWNKSDSISREILKGKHGESAAITFLLKNGIRGDNTPIPMMQPCTEDGTSVFVYQPEVALHFIKIQMLPVLRKMIQNSGAIDEDAFMEKARTVLAYQMELSLSGLAEGLPEFKVTYNNPNDLTDIDISGGEIIGALSACEDSDTPCTPPSHHDS